MKRKYLALLRLLLALPQDRTSVSLGLDEIEELVGSPLPAAAMVQGFWTSSSTATTNWEFDGFLARLDHNLRVVTFTRGKARIT